MRSFKHRELAFSLCAAALAASVSIGSATAQVQLAPAALNAAPFTPNLSATAGAKVTELKKIDVAEGKGAEAVPGKAAIVHYTGWLYDPSVPDGRGKKFDSSRDGKGIPFGFIIGVGKVIKGWDQGVAGMKVGGKRTLVIPPELGYGEGGAGNVIPPNATLVFDIELIDVKG